MPKRRIIKCSVVALIRLEIGEDVSQVLRFEVNVVCPFFSLLICLAIRTELRTEARILTNPRANYKDILVKFILLSGGVIDSTTLYLYTFASQLYERY